MEQDTQVRDGERRREGARERELKGRQADRRNPWRGWRRIVAKKSDDRGGSRREQDTQERRARD